MNKVEVVPSMFKLFEIYPRVELLSRFLRFLVYLEAINEPSGSTWYALNLFNVQKKRRKKDRIRVRRSLSSFPRLLLGTGLIAGITKARRYAYRDSFFS